MTINDQTDQLLFELQAVLKRFVDEYDLNHATIIGCVEILKIDFSKGYLPKVKYG